MDIKRLQDEIQASQLDAKIKETLLVFFSSYEQETQSFCKNDLTSLFIQYIHWIEEEQRNPTTFDYFHLFERYPIDFYKFGLDFVSPLIDWSCSYVEGENEVRNIVSAMERRENVMLLANHQTEIDAQVISLLVDPISRDLAMSMVFMAGHRVRSDPLAVPFSRGRNLLCIYSKRYVDFPPEDRASKLLHNAKTLSKLEELLEEGGICVYVAPSGGRDRFDESGNVKVAPFDPQSVEMLSLLAKRVTKPTHFHPLALYTQHLLPPPETVNIELGELRQVSFGPARLFFGPSVALDEISAAEDRMQQRVERAEILTKQVEGMYQHLIGQENA